jgi:hypothetical protein
MILFECSTQLLKLLLDDASYQKMGLEKIFSHLLKTSEEQLSTDEFTNICHRLDEIQILEDTKFSKKRDAKLKRDGIKPKTPIDSTEDTVVRKMCTRRFRRKTMISDLIRSMTDSSLVFLLGFGIQLLFLTNLGISMTSFMSDTYVDRSSLVSFFE